jgi:hypothetical protein
MADQSDETRRRLEEAVTEADDAFWNDRSVIFGTEADKKRQLFDHVKRVSKAWARPGQCMYRGCAEPSIRRSHSIQRAGSLELIAEDQHVLTPRLDHHGQFRMERIGVNLASTFPGFCHQHEQLFSEFEMSGSVSSERHVALQGFRTLCREIARKRQMIDGLERLLDHYQKARTDYYSSAIQKKHLGTISTLVVKGDGMEKYLVSTLRGTKADLSELEGDLYEQFFDYVGIQTQEPSLQAISLPFCVPVSLSGFGVLTYKHHRKKHRALCPLGILPQDGKTVAFIAAAHKHSAIVEMYRAGMEFGFGALNAMESWMTNGSDHWFIRPSTWASIPPTRQTKVLELLRSEDDNIGTLLDFSILDDTRLSMIKYIRDHLEEAPNRAKALEMVAFESAKLGV